MACSKLKLTIKWSKIKVVCLILPNFSKSIKIDDIKNYKEWNFYKLEDPETKQCLTFFEDLGGSLVDYEVVYCYAYPEKYDEKNN